MNWIHVFSIFGVLGNVLRGSAASEDGDAVKIINYAPNTIQEIIDYMTDILNSYIVVLDHIATYGDVNENMTNLQGDFSNEANTIAGQIYSSFLSVMDDSFTTGESIYEWCSLSTNLLTTYKRLIEMSSAAKVKMQNRLLKQILDSGILKADIEQNVLFANFHQASEKVDTLFERLEFDYNEKSEYFKFRVNLLRSLINGSNDTKTILTIVPNNSGQEIPWPPFNPRGEKPRKKRETSKQHNSQSTERPNDDATFNAKVMDLRKKFDFIQEYVLTLKTKMSTTQSDIGTTKINIQQKIKEVSAMKLQIEQIDTLLPEFIEPIQESIDKLITRCNEYREQQYSIT